MFKSPAHCLKHRPSTFRHHHLQRANRLHCTSFNNRPNISILCTPLVLPLLCCLTHWASLAHLCLSHPAQCLQHHTTVYYYLSVEHFLHIFFNTRRHHSRLSLNITNEFLIVPFHQHILLVTINNQLNVLNVITNILLTLSLITRPIIIEFIYNFTHILLLSTPSHLSLNLSQSPSSTPSFQSSTLLYTSY